MYIFAHGDLWHLIGNVVFQLILGTLLELVHKWRIPIIYLGSAVGGSLMHSLLNGGVRMYGASGGVFGLIGARIAEIVLIRKEMTWPNPCSAFIDGEMSFYQMCKILIGGKIGQVLIVMAFGSYAVCNLVRIVVQHAIGISTTSLGAHLGGLVVGTLLGIVTLKEDKNKRNRIVDHHMRALENEDYKRNPTFFKRIEITLRKKKCKVVAFSGLATFVLFAICWNALHVALSAANSTQCLQPESVQTNVSDPCNVDHDNNVIMQPSSDVENDDWATKMRTLNITQVTDHPIAKPVSTPRPDTPLNRTSAAGRLTYSNRSVGYLLVSIIFNSE
jgi:membrane associated rhomboid family serine protease